MKQLTIFTFLLLSIGNVFCQEYKMRLWEGDPPNFKSSNLVEIYDTTDIVRIEQVSVPDIAVFLPSKSIATGQAVVICPGGGYRILAYTKEGTDFAKWLNSKGIAAIVLKYRLPNPESSVTPHLSPLLDAKRAIQMTRYHAEQWNIDPTKVGVMGFSAGGHVASTLGTHFDREITKSGDVVSNFSNRPDFMILVYPVISFNPEITHSGSVNNLVGENPSPELIKLYSNELQVADDTPPTFLIHCQDDRAVPVQNSLRFYDSLLEHGISAEMHLYPEGGHGFGFGYGKGQVENWTESLFRWLENMVDN